jgi:hypothetical protein
VRPLACKPAATPPSANSTASTSGVSGTMMNTTSAWRVTSAALAQAMAEEALMASGNGPMVLTNSAWPASIRCSAIGTPMMPRPMNPIFM